MKIANLIDITPEDIAKLEKLGYAGMNVNLATGRIDLVKAETKEEDSCCCDCCCCDEDNEAYDEYYEDEEEEYDEDEELREELEDCVSNLAEIINKILN